MSRRSIGRFFKGRKGIEGAFERKGSYKLSRFLTSKEKKHALRTLRKYKAGGGISVSPGRGGSRDLDKATREWIHNKKDSISRTEARMIRRELENYQRNLEASPNIRRGASVLHKNRDNFGSDPRASQNSIPSLPGQAPTPLPDSLNTVPISAPDNYDFNDNGPVSTT